MALNKVNYVDGSTVISADNLNAIQDEIINNKETKGKITIDNREYTVRTSTTNAGVEGYITFVIS